MPNRSALALFITAGCSTGDTACQADHVLHWLYVAAGVLAVGLVVVILLAVQVWRRNRDEDPDA